MNALPKKCKSLGICDIQTGEIEKKPICVHVRQSGCQNYYKTVRPVSDHLLLPAEFGDVRALCGSHSHKLLKSYKHSLLNKKVKGGLFYFHVLFVNKKRFLCQWFSNMFMVQT